MHSLQPCSWCLFLQLSQKLYVSMMDDVVQDTDKTVGVRCSDISKAAKEAVCVCEYTCIKINVARGEF